MSGVHLGSSSTTTYSKGELHRVDIQVLIRQGIPKLDIVGLPQNVIREGSNRILSALHLLGFSFKSQKILVSLNPADLKKEGSHFDLPILVAILKAMNIVASSPQASFYWGELNLDGSLRPFDAFLPHLLYVQTLQPHDLMAPVDKSELESVQAYLQTSLKPIQHIQELFQSDSSTPNESTQRDDSIAIQRAINQAWLRHSVASPLWNSLRGHLHQFEVFAMAALGRLHLLLEGAPGVGKTYWAQAYREIQLPLDYRFWHERSHRQSLSQLSPSTLVHRPFLSPHHQSSSASLLGNSRAGFMADAHGGCLFLDEMPEFRRDVLEALREPLESKHMTIGRAHGHYRYAADIQLLATMNPCPCGRRGTKRRCYCSSARSDLYQSRISQPLRDRFHLHLWWRHYDEPMPEQSDEDTTTFASGESFDSKTPWELASLKQKLLEAQSFEVKSISPRILGASDSPRRQKLMLEVFAAWCQWHQIAEASARDVQRFQTFLSFFENPIEKEDAYARFL